MDQVKKLKCDIEKDIGPVDILINNAGLIPLLSLREGTEAEIERIVKVNITSQFFVNNNNANICTHVSVLMTYLIGYEDVFIWNDK